VTPDLEHVAPRLVLGPDEQPPPTEVASRAVEACERLVHHLSRLLGDTSVAMLFERSIVLASRKLPWLRAAAHDRSVQDRTTLREVLERQDSASIVAAFVAILSALIGLLERLIGEGLVARLLNEVWPTVFVSPAKDVP